jgi:PAS domain S-box-containing protein
LYAVDCDGATTLCNPAFLKMLGFAREEDAVGRKLHDVIHHSHPDGTHYPVRDCPIYVCARDGTPAHVTDELFYRLDGTPLPVEYWAHPIVRDGKLQGANCTFLDTTERKVAGVRQQFLLDLSDRIREAPDPIAVTTAAAELLGRHLHVARAGYGEIDAGEEVLSVARDWTDDGVASLAGEARLLDGFGPAVIAELKAGRTLIVQDFRTDPRAGPDYAATWSSIDTRALIVVPLVKSGRLRAILYVHEPQPRSWTDTDVALAETTAERTWDAVSRAEAEAKLRESEDHYRHAVELNPQTVWTSGPDGQLDRVGRRWSE